MSGEISVKERNLKKEFAALAFIFAVAFAATSLILRLFDMSAAARNAAEIVSKMLKFAFLALRDLTSPAKSGMINGLLGKRTNRKG